MSTGDTIFDFGRHRGKKVSDVPQEYLIWLCDDDSNPKDVVVRGTNWTMIAHAYLQEQRKLRAAQPKPAKPSRFDDPDFRRQACEIEPVVVDGVTYTLMCNYGLEESYWTFATYNDAGNVVPTNVPNTLYGDQYKVIRSWITDKNKSVPESFYH